MIRQSSFSRVYLPVTIGVDIFYVTALPLVVSFKEAKVYRSQIFIHFTVSHEKIISFISPNLTDVHSLIIPSVTCQTGMVIEYQSFRIIILRDYCLVIGYIKTDTITESAFQLILPIDGQLPTTITESRIIYFCTVVFTDTSDSRNCFSRTNHIMRCTLVNISSYCQTVIQ